MKSFLNTLKKVVLVGIFSSVSGGIMIGIYSSNCLRGVEAFARSITGGGLAIIVVLLIGIPIFVRKN